MPHKPRTSPATEHANRDSRVWLGVAVALTFLIRLWFVLSMRGQPFSTIGPQMLDSYYYHRWAIEIISGNFWGSDVFFLRPLYPYLLALAYALFGQHILAVQIIQAMLAGVSCFLLYEVTRRILGKRPAALASVGFALTGILVFYTGTLLYVELTIFLSLLFVWLVLLAIDSNFELWHSRLRPWLWIAAGVSFGLLVICRPELLILLPLLLWWLWRISRVHSPASKVPRLALPALALTALAVIAVVPVRNYIVARDPVLFTAHSGINFYYGNNPSADGTWQPTAELERGPGFSHERLKRISRTIDGRQAGWSEASAYWTRQGIRFITHEPGKYLRLLGRKFLLFFSNYEVPNDYYPETARAASLPLRLAFVNFGLVLALALVGMVWAWPKRSQALPAYVFVAAYLLSALLFYVLSRLRAPVLPFLLMFAGYGLSELVDAFRQRRAGRAMIGIVIVVAIYIVSVLIPVRRQSYSAQAWTQNGNIYLDRRKVGPAIEAFNRALAVQPGAYAARYSLVLALAGSGKVDAAAAEFEQLAKAAGSSSEGRALVRLASARLAIARRDFPQAAILYQSALADYPDDAETRYLLGLVYISMDSLVQAREQLGRAVALDPGQDAARAALKAVESRMQR
jgi:4-amino-4-deoxy-L-arabinose transferase-like glycosyltransferase